MVPSRKPSPCQSTTSFLLLAVCGSYITVSCAPYIFIHLLLKAFKTSSCFIYYKSYLPSPLQSRASVLSTLLDYVHIYMYYFTHIHGASPWY